MSLEIEILIKSDFLEVLDSKLEIEYESSQSDDVSFRTQINNYIAEKLDERDVEVYEIISSVKDNEIILTDLKYGENYDDSRLIELGEAIIKILSDANLKPAPDPAEE